MDKVFSTRVDESVALRLAQLATAPVDIFK
jgi:hypothetical protein